jgi:hypothetical protein
MSSEHIKGKSKDQILDAMVGTAERGSVVHEQLKMAIVARSTDELGARMAELGTAIKDSSASADRLGRKLFWLNVILVIATAVGAAAALAGVLSKSQ